MQWLENQNLFLWSRAFVCDFLKVPGDGVYFLDIFVVQFFYVPILGCLLMAGICMGIYSLQIGIYLKLKTWRLEGKTQKQSIHWIQLGSLVILSGILSCFNFENGLSLITIVYFLNLLGVYLFLWIQQKCEAHKWMNIGLSTILLMSGYWLCGGWIWVLLLEILGLHLLYTKGSWQKIQLIGWNIAAVLAVIALYLWLGNIQGLEKVFFNGIPNFEQGHLLWEWRRGDISYLFILGFWLCLWMALKVSSFHKKNQRIHSWWKYIGGIGIGGLLVASPLYFQDKEAEKLGRIEQLSQQEKWNEVLKYCDQYWIKHPQNGIQKYDYSFAKYTKLALLMSHKLTHRYFTYFQFPYIAPMFYTEEYSDPIFFTQFFYLTGNYAQALHYASFLNKSKAEYSSYGLKLMALSSAALQDEALRRMNTAETEVLEVIPLQGMDSIKLVETRSNRVRVGKEDWRLVAKNHQILNQKALTILSKTLFHRKFVKNFEKERFKIAERNQLFIPNTQIVDSLSSTPVAPQRPFLQTKVVDYTMKMFAFQNYKNAISADYVFNLALLRKDLGFVGRNIGLYKELGYTQLPLHVEEALLLCINYNVEGSPYNSRTIIGSEFAGFSIREETLARFEFFERKLRGLQQGSVAEADFIREFGNTFWFYYLFAAPDFVAV